jgi:hypothetical protein
MLLTTKNIIKLLPLEEVFKKKLLDGYDQLPFAKRFALEQVTWDIYDAYVQVKIEENIALALDKAQYEDNGLINPEFYDKIKEQTEKEIQEKGVLEAEKVDLVATREQLASVIGDNPDNG